MLDLSHLLTGTDFSDKSTASVREALRLAAGDPARRVTVLHATDAISKASAMRQRVLDWVMALPEASALDPSQIIPDLEVGRVADAFVRCAQRIGATQLVVGPRPHGFVETWITGGIAEKLFHRVSVPVLATRTVAEGGYRNILLPLDLSEVSAEAFQMALDLVNDACAAHPEARIHLLHVAHRMGGISGARELEDPIRLSTTAQLKALTLHMDAAARVGSYTAAFGVVHDIIPKQIDALGVDLICMVTRHSSNLMGSTVDAVLRNIQVPLWVAWLPH